MKKLDLVGQKFGRLEVISLSHIGKNGRSYWLCKCNCNKEKIVSSNNLRNGNTKSCGCFNREKASKIHKSKVISQEIRNKISESLKGRKHTLDSRKKMSEIQKNRFISEDHKRKISNTLKGKYVGNKHPNWNSNKTDKDRVMGRYYPAYYEWRKYVYERDNYTCQKCGIKSKNLRAHHIESYNNNPDLRTTLLNGITLCKSCHKDFHHQYGYGNNTKEQLIKFIEGRIE